MLGVVAPTPTRHRLACIVVAVALLVTACATSVPPAPPRIDNVREPIQQMLRERAMALREGNVEGYLQGLSPEARAFEAPIAERALTVPLEEIDLTIGGAVISDDGTEFRNARIDFDYRYTGLPDDNLFRFGLLYDLERRDDAWVVTSSEFNPDADAPPPPWATGEVELAESEHFLAMMRPGLGRIDEALALAETARQRLVAKLTLEPDPRHLILLAGDEEQYAGMTGGNAEGSVAVAHVVHRESAAYPLRPENREMAANLELVFDQQEVPVRHEARPEAFPVEVFEHELAHLALSRFTRPSTPGWVIEGGAMLLSGEQRTGEWAEARDTGVLNGVSLANMLDGADMGPLQYGYANAAVLYLVETHGEETFFEFYRNFKEFSDDRATPMLAETRSAGAERLLRRYYRFGVEELDGFTRAYIRRAT